jgi:hypothetical protein
MVSAMFVLVFASLRAQTQTPGQITKFDPDLNVVDSVITQDPSGNIGIGTTTPAAALDVATGDLNLTGNILKGGTLFLHSNPGNGNTFLGQYSGNLSMTGGANTGIGNSALANNNEGYSNTAIGYLALVGNHEGNDNTANGYFALESNTSGSYNTANGVNALGHNTIGSFTTASGVAALVSNTGGIENTANGANALGDNTIGFRNTGNGIAALGRNSEGNDNTADGASALIHNINGSYNTAIGSFADVSFGGMTNATAIGAFSLVDASNKIRLGNGAVTVIEGQVPYTFTSDRNQKERFQPVDGEGVLRKLSGLNLTSWNYIGHNPQQFRHYGPVAQEFFAAFGHDGVGTNGTPTTINSGDMEGILMIAVQALEKRTAENAELKARIEALERLVNGTQTDRSQHDK